MARSEIATPCAGAMKVIPRLHMSSCLALTTGAFLSSMKSDGDTKADSDQDRPNDKRKEAARSGGLGKTPRQPKKLQQFQPPALACVGTFQIRPEALREIFIGAIVLDKLKSSVDLFLVFGLGAP